MCSLSKSIIKDPVVWSDLVLISESSIAFRDGTTLEPKSSQDEPGRIQ